MGPQEYVAHEFRSHTPPSVIAKRLYQQNSLAHEWAKVSPTTSLWHPSVVTSMRLYARQKKIFIFVFCIRWKGACLSASLPTYPTCCRRKYAGYFLLPIYIPTGSSRPLSLQCDCSAISAAYRSHCAIEKGRTSCVLDGGNVSDQNFQ